MTRSQDTPPLFGRRQFLIGGGTFVAGIVGLAAWSASHPAASTSTSTTGPPTTSLPPPSTTAAPSIPSSTTTAPTEPVSVVDTASITTDRATLPTTTGGPASYVSHGPTDVAKVALTFHLDGDPQLVTELLDALRGSGVTSTLFAVGDWLTANPDLGHRAIDDGHELGNHTKSHKSMLKLSADDVFAEIVGGGQALIPFIGSIGRWFRPSGTDVPSNIILEQAGRAGYAVSVGYDVDSRDFTEPGAAAVVKRVRQGLHPGAIVSLHFGHRDTITAWPEIVGLVDAAGLTPVTVSGLLG